MSATEAGTQGIDGVAATGRLGVRALYAVWSRWDAMSRGEATAVEVGGPDIRLIFDGIGIGLEQAYSQSMTHSTFAAFEDWIAATVGELDPARVAWLNAALGGSPPPDATRRELAEIDAMAPVLSAADLAHWEEHGFVIVPDAIDADACAATADVICRHVGADLDDPDSWYAPNDHGIMVQLFQDPALEANRRSARIHKAFAQLWGTSDLWVSTDRVGFNAPERQGHSFRGPHLHWDVSLHQPIPFGTQGLIYVTDTDPEQGALTLVPGFHRTVGAWLDSLPSGTDPRSVPLDDLAPEAIGGRAGDCIIWHQALPHGSRPNRTACPWLVHYVNRYPQDYEVNPIWL